MKKVLIFGLGLICGVILGKEFPGIREQVESIDLEAFCNDHGYSGGLEDE